MTHDEEVRIQATYNELAAQRNNALDRVVMLTAEVNALQAKLQEMTEAKKDAEPIPAPTV